MASFPHEFPGVPAAHARPSADRKALRRAAWPLAILVLAGCGSTSAGPPSPAPSDTPSQPSTAAPTPAGTTPVATASSIAIPQWTGSIVYTDAQHYNWKLSWSFVPAPASDAAPFTANDKPSDATVKIPVSGSLELTNMSSRNAVPANSMGVYALYPARSAICSYLDEEDGDDSEPFTINGVRHPSCPILLMTNGSFYGNATLTPGASFSPRLAWRYYSFINDPPYNVFLLPATQEKAAVRRINNVRPLLLVLGISDRGSNPRQCESGTIGGSSFFVVDTDPVAELKC